MGYRDVLSPVSIRTDPGAQLASCTVGAGALSRGQSGQGLFLTTHPHLEPRLRMGKDAYLWAG